MKIIYLPSFMPQMFGMAKLSRKLKSFRLSPEVAAAVERVAKDANASEGEVIDLCVMNSLESVVSELTASSPVLNDSAMDRFSSLLHSWKASLQTKSNKVSYRHARGKRRKAQ